MTMEMSNYGNSNAASGIPIECITQLHLGFPQGASKFKSELLNGKGMTKIE